MNTLALILTVLQIPVIYLIKKIMIDKYGLFEDFTEFGKWTGAVFIYFVLWVLLFVLGGLTWCIYSIFDAITK